MASEESATAAATAAATTTTKAAKGAAAPAAAAASTPTDASRAADAASSFFRRAAAVERALPTSLGVDMMTPFRAYRVTSRLTFGVLTLPRTDDDADDDGVVAEIFPEGFPYVPVEYDGAPDGMRAYAVVLWDMAYGERQPEGAEEVASTTCGVYDELVVSFLVRDRAAEEPPLVLRRNDPFKAPEFLLTNPSARMYVWRLWLDRHEPIVYGRELLGLDKHAANFVRSVHPSSDEAAEVTIDLRPDGAVDNPDVLARGDADEAETEPLCTIRYPPRPSFTRGLVRASLGITGSWAFGNTLGFLAASEFTVRVCGRPNLFRFAANPDTWPEFTARFANNIFANRFLVVPQQGDGADAVSFSSTAEAGSLPAAIFNSITPLLVQYTAGFSQRMIGYTPEVEVDGGTSESS